MNDSENPDPIIVPVLKSNFLERYLASSDPLIVSDIKKRVMGVIKDNVSLMIEREKRNSNILIGTERKFRIKLCFREDEEGNLHFVRHLKSIPLADSSSPSSSHSGETFSVIFYGQMDRIEKAPDGTIVLKELKTSENAARRMAFGQQQQVSLYFFALSLIYPNQKFRLIVESIKGDASYELVPSESIFEDAKTLIEGTINGIRKGLFYARPTTECASCSFKSRCVAFKQAHPILSRSRPQPPSPSSPSSLSS